MTVGQARGGSSRGGGRMLLAFATGACCVAALALAFNLGRHWPLGAREEKETNIPSLGEVRRRGPIPYAELAIDPGTATDNSPRTSASADVQNAKQATGDRR